MIKPIVAKLISPPKVSNFGGACYWRVDVYCLLSHFCSTKLLADVICTTQHALQGFGTIRLNSAHNCSARIIPAILSVVLLIDLLHLVQQLSIFVCFYVNISIQFLNKPILFLFGNRRILQKSYNLLVPSYAYCSTLIGSTFLWVTRFLILHLCHPPSNIRPDPSSRRNPCAPTR